jgi:hypothetical protein
MWHQALPQPYFHYIMMLDKLDHKLECNRQHVSDLMLAGSVICAIEKEPEVKNFLFVALMANHGP